MGVPPEIPSGPGIYQLFIRVEQPVSFTCGMLGELSLAPGLYVYTGSAMRGLRARVGRHLRSEKRLHWHVDYLLQHGSIVDVACMETTERIECRLHAELVQRHNATLPIPGFGSSDCRCVSHLALLGDILTPTTSAGTPARCDEIRPHEETSSWRYAEVFVYCCFGSLAVPSTAEEP